MTRKILLVTEYKDKQCLFAGFFELKNEEKTSHFVDLVQGNQVGFIVEEIKVN